MTVTDRATATDTAAIESRALNECRAGRIEGLQVLYTLHSLRVYRTCVRVLGDPVEAEDMTQDIFLRVHDKVAHFDQRSSFSTWLYRLTVNHCLNRLRGRTLLERRFRPLEAASDAEDGRRGPQLELLKKESIDLVGRLLDRLSDEHRAIVVLRDIEGLSYREIAEVLSIPSGTVMSRLYRARRQLKDIWADSPLAEVRRFRRRSVMAPREAEARP